MKKKFFPTLLKTWKLKKLKPCKPLLKENANKIYECTTQMYTQAT